MPRLTRSSEESGSKKFVLSPVEQQMLRQIGLRIANDLARTGCTVEDLAFKASIARSTLREIIAGRSNPRVLTLHAIAVGLGYSSLVTFCGSALETSEDSSITRPK